MEPNPTTDPSPRARCKNCDKKLAKKGSFCPHCGQHDFDGRVSLRDLFSKFFHNLTHLDGKFLRMMWHLLIPAKVSIAYFKGQIRRYPHPVQFYFVTAFFFLLLLNKTIENTKEKAFGEGGMVKITATPNKDGVTRDIKLDASAIFPMLSQYEEMRAYRVAVDSLPPEWGNETTRKALDSVLSRVSNPQIKILESILTELDTASGKRESLDTIPLAFGFGKADVATSDLVHLSPKEIVEKYKIQGWVSRLMAAQSIKSLKEPSALMHQYIGSLAWTMLALLAAMAGVLLLFFKRLRSYYSEHFVFLLHQSSAELLLISLAMFVNLYLIALGVFWIVIPLWIMLAFGISMRRFYGQGGIGLYVKLGVYYILYLIFGLILFLIGLLVSLAIF